jgi:hypothetical protein
MKRSTVTLSVLGAASLAILAGSATAHDRHNKPEVVRAFLAGPNEAPAVSSNSTGRFRAVIDEDSQTITFTLSYEGLEGGNTLAAHIHLGERHTNGGVMVFLCGGGTTGSGRWVRRIAGCAPHARLGVRECAYDSEPGRRDSRADILIELTGGPARRPALAASACCQFLWVDPMEA